MRGKLRRSNVVRAFFLLVAGLYVHTAQAEFILKRLKCSEFENEVYYNKSGSTDTVSVQIIRDGCMPKNAGYLNYTDGTTAFEMARTGRTGPVYRVSVINNGAVGIRFINVLSVTRGTYDVKVDVD